MGAGMLSRQRFWILASSKGLVVTHPLRIGSVSLLRMVEKLDFIRQPGIPRFPRAPQ